MNGPDIEVDQLENWLLEQDPHLVLQWLHEMVEGTRQLPVGFNWHGIAECAAFDVWRRDGHRSALPHVGWANVAVFAYSYIIDKVKEQGHFSQVRPGLDLERKKQLAFSFEESLMNLRVGCIRRLGSVPGDPVLDVSHLVQWFFQDLRFSPEEALEQFASQKRAQLRREERWEFTRLLRKLALLQSLEQQHLLPVNQELQIWFSIGEQLRRS